MHISNVANRKLCPVEIKLLAVLRILGRNWNFDDIAEATLMGETTARRAFHTFCENFVREFYSTYVCRPGGEKLKKVMDVYARMGLPGCIGSTDCVHLKWENPPLRATSRASACCPPDACPEGSTQCALKKQITSFAFLIIPVPLSALTVSDNFSYAAGVIGI